MRRYFQLSLAATSAAQFTPSMDDPPHPSLPFPHMDPSIKCLLGQKKKYHYPSPPPKSCEIGKKEESESRVLLARKFSSLTIKMPLACLLAASSFKRQKKEKNGGGPLKWTMEEGGGESLWHFLSIFHHL